MNITTEFCETMRQNYEQNAKNKLAELTATRNGIVESAENSQAKRTHPFVFSTEVPALKVPQQYHSGRCWLFAIVNLLNQRLSQSLGTEAFELSPNYLYFYDKLEKANFFYQNMIQTADLELTSRELDFLLSKPQEDGGQWDMLVSLIEKYGMVPLTAMPETENSRSSADLNKYLNAKLRIDGKQIRQLVAAGSSPEELDEVIATMLEEVYRLLGISIGLPPKEFDLAYRDTTGTYQLHKGLTPKEFAQRFLTLDLKDYVPVINGVDHGKVFDQAYTVAMMGNVVEGQKIKYLNVDMATLKDLTIRQLEGQEAVWFGSDVGQLTDRKLGVMATDIYDVDNLFGIDFSSNKKDRLEYRQSRLTHAMVITGVDIREGHPAVWKVQNSWGTDIGYDGFFLMTDAWMDEYVYQVVIHRQYLPQDLLDKYQAAPIVLDPWDPMGSLA